MSPIERAARALALWYIINRDAWSADDPYAVDWVNSMWREYVAPARAVIAAIREPSEEMVKAAEGVDFIGPGENDFIGEWRAAIDALAEGG